MELYTVKEVSEILKTNSGYVYKLIDAGLIRAMKLGRLKVSSFELEEFLKRNVGLDLTDPYNPCEILEGENKNEN